MASPDWGAVFRLSCVLDEEVDPLILDGAVARALRRFRPFAVSLRRGLFWYYHEEIDAAPPVLPEAGPLCAMPDASDNEGHLFRVLHRGSRVSLELFHSLADGSGALSFLKTIVACYYEARGLPIVEGEGVLDPDGAPDPEESEDAFARYAGDPRGRSFAEERAWSPPGPGLPPPGLRLVAGRIEAAALAAKAKERGATITALLSGCFLKALDASQREDEGLPQLPVRLQIPVNMRKACPSRTLRNFSLYANVALPLSERPPSLDEAVRAAAEGMRAGHDPDELAKMMALNVSAERHPALRAAPLALKRLALRTAYALVGDASFTAALSNLGAVALPEPLSARVREFGFALGRGRKPGVNLAVVGYSGKVLATTTSDLIDRNVEREFFRTLSGLGLDVEIESNDGGAA